MVLNTQEPGAFSNLLAIFFGAEVIIQLLIYLQIRDLRTPLEPALAVSYTHLTLPTIYSV